jgi:toxin ParE1/3/4
VAKYRLSQEADNDIAAIAQHTMETWSEAQADRYLLGLHDVLQRLAANPRLGIASDEIRADYRRRRYRSHMIFYKIEEGGIFVVRVLHAHMDYVRHF